MIFFYSNRADMNEQEKREIGNISW